MVEEGSPRRNSSPGWHDRVEAYTPDGAIGRFVLSWVTGTVCFFALVFSIAGLTTAGALSGLLGVLFAALFVGSGLLTALLLWPIYLSLIGKLESTADYGASSDDAADPDDPLTALKREYATGEISEAAFERRLDRLVDVEAVEQSRAASDDRDDVGELRGAGASDVSRPSESVDAIVDELDETAARGDSQESDAREESRETETADEVPEYE